MCVVLTEEINLGPGKVVDPPDANECADATTVVC